MRSKIRRFTKGPPETVNALNEIVDALNWLIGMSSDGFIKINQIGESCDFRLDIEKLLPYILRKVEAPVEIRQALCVENAPTGNVISAKLQKPDGTWEDEPTDIYCLISNGSDLSTSSRLLVSGDILNVQKMQVLVDVELVYRWFAQEGFQGNVICVCTPP